ncbi:MAG: hypothetical protein H0Z37_07330 [Firmicutes bacterium]|nr:hypothetical protein [Bacillota bacterium]
MDILGRSILASFHRREDAQQAMRALRREGFTVQLDRASPYPGAETGQREHALAGQVGTLSDPAAVGDATGEDPRAFLDASGVVAPGLDRGLNEPSAGQNTWLVTVVTEEDRVNRAVQILEDAGGTV